MSNEDEFMARLDEEMAEFYRRSIAQRPEIKRQPFNVTSQTRVIGTTNVTADEPEPDAARTSMRKNLGVPPPPFNITAERLDPVLPNKITVDWDVTHADAISYQCGRAFTSQLGLPDASKSYGIMGSVTPDGTMGRQSHTFPFQTTGTCWVAVREQLDAGGTQFGIWSLDEGVAAEVPSNLTATPGNTQISLSWTGVTGGSSYNIYRATSSGGPFTNVGSSATTSFTDTGLTNGTTYYYYVTAVVSGSESGPSTTVSAVAGYPDALDVSAPGTVTGSVAFTITVTAKSGGVTLTSFNGTGSMGVTGAFQIAGVSYGACNFVSGVANVSCTAHATATPTGSGSFQATCTVGSVTGTSFNITVNGT